MTDNSGQEISWLEYRSRKTGQSIEELKAEMSRRSNLADKSKTGFASLTPEQAKAVSLKGKQAREAKKRVDNS